MATKTAGGAVTGRLGITCEAGEALVIADVVELTASYTVAKPTAKGSNKILGHVAVAGGSGKDITVEARGDHIETLQSGEALTAVGPVIIGANAKVYMYDDTSSPPDTPDMIYGLNLNTTTAAAQNVDVMPL